MSKIAAGRHLNKVIFAVAIMAICSLFISCSSKYDDVESQCKTFVSDDVELVLNIDLSRLAQATDTKVDGDGVIELSEPVEGLIRKTMGKDVRDFLERLPEFKGMAFKNILFAMDYDKRKAIVLTPLCDEDDFVKSLLDITEIGFDKMPQQDGYQVVDSHDFAIYVKDNLAFIVIDEDGPVKGNGGPRQIERWRDNAKEQHLADWKIDYLKAENAGSMLVNTEYFADLSKNSLSNGNELDISMVPDWVGLTCDIDKEQIKAACECFTKKGEEFKVKYLSKFDTSLLNYVTKQDIAVVGLGFNSKMISDEVIKYMSVTGASATQIAEVSNYLSGIKGGIMIAAGPKGGLSTLAEGDPDAIHFVLAANADGNSLLDLLAKNGLTVEPNGTIRMPVGGEYDWDTGEYTYNYQTWYTHVDSDIFVLSNSPISTNGNPKIDKAVFADKCFACWAGVSKKDPLLEQLHIPFGVTLTGRVDNHSSEGEVAIQVTGTDKTLVNAVIDAVLGNI